MFTLDGSHEVAASADTLWRLLTDPGLAPRYAPGLVEAKVLSGDPTRVGACVTEYTYSSGRKVRGDSMVLEVIPRRRIVSEGVIGVARWRTRYELSALPPLAVEDNPRAASDAALPRCTLAYQTEYSVRGAGGWLLSAVTLFLPVIGLYQARGQAAKTIQSLVLVAEALEREGLASG